MATLSSAMQKVAYVLENKIHLAFEVKYFIEMVN